jgi:hypothetical protein
MEIPRSSNEFELYYSRRLDRFQLTENGIAQELEDGEEVEDNEAIDFAELTFGNPTDYALFDNNEPGKILKITHEGSNQPAIELLSRTVFGPMYQMICEAFREGTQIYNEAERTRTLLVPYSRAREMAALALHASAEYASEEVTNLYKTVEIPTTGDGGGEVPQPLV